MTERTTAAWVRWIYTSILFIGAFVAAWHYEAWIAFLLAFLLVWAHNAEKH
jgi:hypothetical protein